MNEGSERPKPTIGRFEVAEKAALLRDDRILVLLLDRNGKQAYQLPGGRVDTGEQAGSALVREIEEETGLAVDRSELTPYDTRTIEAEPVQYAVFFYADAPNGGVQLSSDHESYAWMLEEELAASEFHFEAEHHAALAAFSARAASRTR